MSTSPRTGGVLFLHDWTGIAGAFDIATGYFEIGALLALDGKWQKPEKIRILMGDEVSQRTRHALLDGLRERIAKTLDASGRGRAKHRKSLSRPDFALSNPTCPWTLRV